MRVLLKSSFSLTEVTRNTEENKGNLIKNFEFIMALNTLRNQSVKHSENVVHILI